MAADDGGGDGGELGMAVIGERQSGGGADSGQATGGQMGRHAAGRADRQQRARPDMASASAVFPSLHATKSRPHPETATHSPPPAKPNTDDGQK